MKLEYFVSSLWVALAFDLPILIAMLVWYIKRQQAKGKSDDTVPLQFLVVWMIPGTLIYWLTWLF